MHWLKRQFGTSRKTGYKILNRYKACGLDGLTDRSRRPYRHANQLPFQIETLIVRLKQQAELARAEDQGKAGNGNSTVHAVLDRHGLVTRRIGRRRLRRSCPGQSSERGDGPRFRGIDPALRRTVERDDFFTGERAAQWPNIALWSRLRGQDHHGIGLHRNVERNPIFIDGKRKRNFLCSLHLWRGQLHLGNSQAAR